MSDSFDGSVQFNVEPLFKELNIAFSNMRKNPIVLSKTHELFFEYMEDYIPEESGSLKQNVSIDENGIYFDSEYAHYMYEGIVYRPNFPIIRDGVIVRWWSPPGEGTKYMTNDSIFYSSPLATNHWDEMVIQNHGQEFAVDVCSEISAYLRSLRHKK